MKKFIILSLIFVLCFSYAIFGINCKKPMNVYAQDFEYTDKVHHLFTHCLLAFPNIAFSKENRMSKYLSNDCITPDEFSNIILQLFQNDYVLVDINTIFKTDQNGKTTKNKIKVPVGKKPLVLSFDDVVYDQKKLSCGMVDKIILNNDKLATQTFLNGTNKISSTNEFIPILENFVKENPTFSINNAKGTICLTGYDGILGYRTGEKNKINRNEEIQSVKPVIKKLKQNGWNFACHSYGHYHMKKISIQKLENEIKLWKTEVEPLIGKTSVYVYPYGEYEIEKDNQISPKHTLLTQAGFKLFCGVGMNYFYSYLPFNSQIKEKTLFMDRVCVDGYTLLNQRQKLLPYFDSQKALDKYRFEI